MDKLIKSTDIVNVVFSQDEFKNIKLTNTGKVRLIRAILESIGSDLAQTDEGKLKIQSFGVFNVRNITSPETGEVRRRVIFRNTL